MHAAKTTPDDPRVLRRAVDALARPRTFARRFLLAWVTAVSGMGIALIGPAQAHSDAVAYLVNVTVRPGYGFPNADAALSYGNQLCDRIRAGTPYSSLMSEVKVHFGIADEYQASYLITQSANELCSDAVWQLRNSAAGYRPGSE